MKTYPLLFDGLIEWEVPADPREPLIPPEPQEWLGRIADQGDELVLRWHEDWPVAALADCRNARDFALDGIQALVMGDISTAMIAAHHTGRCVEKAQRSFPIQAWLQLSKKANDASAEGRKKQAELADQREAEVIRLFREFTSKGTPARNTTALIQARLKGTKLKLGPDQINKILKKAGLK